MPKINMVVKYPLLSFYGKKQQRFRQNLQVLGYTVHLSELSEPEPNCTSAWGPNSLQYFRKVSPTRALPCPRGGWAHGLLGPYFHQPGVQAAARTGTERRAGEGHTDMRGGRLHLPSQSTI